MRALLTLILVIAMVTTLHAIRIYEKNERAKSILVAPKFSSEREADATIETDSLSFINHLITKQRPVTEMSN
ncbi:hypothetical protein [Pinibacter aurantiacus]|uniref:Uncharacterized protein n=1 Tax=Pinibacter aurantiacus TaxID=2851599 RepID=A0A9E2S2Q5_9BACT|nr:hypothetical protein [Pinibacter aurantiacus]MBV4355523.1 hypothetical protein [Pinibacter aurantiacus]